jgi:hypothetical protein
MHMRTLSLSLLILILAAACSLAATPSTARAVWEVQSSGSDTNGGGFAPGLSAKDVIAATDLTVDSIDSTHYTAGRPFMSADVNKWLCVTAGTGWSFACSQIVSVASGVATLNRSLTAAGNSSTGTYDLYSANDYSNYPNKNAPGCTFCGSATVNLSTTDAVTNNTTTVISAAANFSAALVGNYVYLNGAGTTTGWYGVVGVANATTITVDRATGGAGGSGITMNIGGALATWAQAALNVQPGNVVYGKATATYDTATNVTWSVAGTIGNTISVIGYSSLRGDNGQVTVRCTAASGGCSGIFTIGVSYYTFANVILDANGKATTRGWRATGGTVHSLDNLKVVGCTQTGVTTAGDSTLNNVWVSGCTSGTAAFDLASAVTCMYCAATGNSVPGFIPASGNRSFISRSISANNAGATTDGYLLTSNGTQIQAVTESISYGNGRDGIRFSAAAMATVALRNNILVSDAGYEINSTTTNFAGTVRALDWDYNAMYNTGSGYVNQANIGAHDLMLTGSPFTNAAGLDFTLNNTAGRGAALRGTAFPGAMQVGGTGYLDFGPFQHQETGGGGQHGCAFVGAVQHNNIPAIWAAMYQRPETAGFPWQVFPVMLLAGVTIAWRARQ